jgi:hypothetical protein
VPLYKDEFGKYSEYNYLKYYLDYIIGECGQDIIINKNDGTGFLRGNENNLLGKNYDGENIPIEILQEYCTTGYNKFTDFMKFLKSNEVYDEIEYNELQEKNKDWMPEINNLKIKYKKFGFEIIHPNKNNYYENKKVCEEKFILAKNKLKNEIGSVKLNNLTHSNLIKKIIQIDNKIPLVDFDLYYCDKNI